MQSALEDHLVFIGDALRAKRPTCIATRTLTTLDLCFCPVTDWTFISCRTPDHLMDISTSSYSATLIYCLQRLRPLRPLFSVCPSWKEVECLMSFQLERCWLSFIETLQCFPSINYTELISRPTFYILIITEDLVSRTRPNMSDLTSLCTKTS